MNEFETVRHILDATHRIALVGASENPLRDSHRIMRYLLAEGFEVDPVNPNAKTVLGRPCVPELAALTHPIDTVVCFRRSDQIEPIARSAIAIRARHLWMQLGIVNKAAMTLAHEAGLLVVMNRCIMVDHQRLHLGRT